MSKHFWCLNEDKTEVLLIGSMSAHRKVNILYIEIGIERSNPAHEAKNIGFIFDHVMNRKKHINVTYKAAWHHLRNIGKTRHYLNRKSTEQLVHAFISYKLDIL